MYASFVRRVVLPLGDVIFGGNYLKSLKKWNEYDTLSESELRAIQEEKLQQILRLLLQDLPRRLMQVQSHSPACPVVNGWK